MKREKTGRPLGYDNSLKVTVAREYLTGNLGYRELAGKYDLHWQTVRYFVKWYNQRHTEGQGIVAAAVTKSDGIEQPLTKEVHKALEEANLKITGLEMLIEIAQKELGVDIVKKYGTKQSRR